ncbi:hypothetical protein B5M09_002749 [Aphanomyces astaci]|uniref:RING-type E3 ubiquitin transferase n=1 Tax=Aphanomyces astaci TaxID=112090 RepID=A0A3R7Y210_APHAT|nr:hypothetical protein B5M09_002749 [Aphanomyces astaci]
MGNAGSIVAGGNGAVARRSTAGGYQPPLLYGDPSTSASANVAPTQYTHAQMQALYMNRGRADMGFIQNQIHNVFQAAPEMQETTTVRNDVNLKKQSLKLVALDPATARLEFLFDAGKPCTVSLYFNAIETIDEAGNSTFTSQKYLEQANNAGAYPAALGQSYVSAPLTLSDWTPAELVHDGKSSAFPLVVEITVIRDASAATKTQKQATFVTFSTDGRKVQVIKQKVEVQGQTYELQEIYGMEGAACCAATAAKEGTAALPAPSAATDAAGVTEGSECSICMCEPRNTTILPCRYVILPRIMNQSNMHLFRHMCICLDCSEQLKRPGSTCPICRGKVESMLQIRVHHASHPHVTE